MKLRSKSEPETLHPTSFFEKKRSKKIKSHSNTKYIFLKVKHLVLFPHQTMPFFPDSDIAYLKKALRLKRGKKNPKLICIAFEVDSEGCLKKYKNLPIVEKYGVFEHAVIATIENRVQVAQGEDGFLLKGMKTVKLKSIQFADDTKTFGECEVEAESEENNTSSREDLTLSKKDESKLKFLKNYLRSIEFIESQHKAKLEACTDLSELCDHITALLLLRSDYQFEYLSIRDREKKFKFLKKCIAQEKHFERLNKNLKDDVRVGIEDLQKKFYIREQIKALKRELGEYEGSSDSTADLRNRLSLLKISPSIRQVLQEEIHRLDHTPEGSPEFAVHHQYLHFVLSLPWNKECDSIRSLQSAAKILEKNHHGLDKVKGRILEYLASMQYRHSPSKTVLALLGPPGVGKTSLAQSIAHALGRKFVKVSLAGVKDEAEIRGHRRTYIGAMPGRILQGIKQAGTNHCVVLLDEIDKAGSSENSSVQSSLLELLDPEQNQRFSDHYVNIEYDLSQVIFIATANDFSRVHEALKDRFEVLELSSYTESEKLHIIQKKLLRKICKESGLDVKEFRFSENQIRRIIRGYTREAGIRELQRIFENLSRKIILHKVQKTSLKFDLNSEEFLLAYLGPPKFISDEFADQNLPGLSFGLAYTDVGGDLLPIEVSLRPSLDAKTSLQLTGSLGTVMKESMLAACTAVSVWTKEKDFDPYFQPEQMHIHVHAPDGGTPKDGPSAGLAISMSLISAFRQEWIPKNIAFTGEISIRGQVLAVGGIKEKILAADRYHKKIVFIPNQNVADLQDVPKEVLDRLEIRPIKNMREVLEFLNW